MNGLMFYIRLSEGVTMAKEKVLDANSVEIKVGETLYWNTKTMLTAKKYIVDKIVLDEDGDYRVYDVSGRWMPPEMLTHERPTDPLLSLQAMRKYVLSVGLPPREELAEWIDLIIELVEEKLGDNNG